MNKRIWVVLGAPIILTGLLDRALAQSDPSQEAGYDQARIAILAHRHALDPRLMPLGSPKAGTAGNPDSYKPQMDSDANGAAKAAEFIVFDVPAATCQSGYPACTTPVAINPAATVTGYYTDASASLHAFVRDRNGTITTFDGPGATCPHYGSICTEPFAINPEGKITGTFCDATTCHGFLRDRKGAITTFDPPGSTYTQPNGINPDGAITGQYEESSFEGARLSARPRRNDHDLRSTRLRIYLPRRHQSARGNHWRILRTGQHDSRLPATPRRRDNHL